MKLLRMFFVLVLLLNISVLSFSDNVSKDSLRRWLNFCDTHESFEKLFATSLKNPELLKEIVFFQDAIEDNSVGRVIAFNFLRECAYLGKIETSDFFDIALNLINKINTFSAKKYTSEHEKLFVETLANFSYDPIQNVHFYKYPINLGKLAYLVGSLEKNNFLTNKELSNYISQNVKEFASLFDKQKEVSFPTLERHLNDLIVEVEKKYPSQINEVGKTILVGYLKNLVNQMHDKN